KTALVRLFCEESGIQLLEINFEKQKLMSLQKDEFVLEDCLHEIESVCGRKIGPQSLIFFDEVQEESRAIERLRYFYEERPQIAVIAAGSLLEVVLNQKGISF